MRPLFRSGPVSVVVPPSDGADMLRQLVELEAAEMVVELGGDIEIVDTVASVPAGSPALVFEVDESVEHPTLTRDAQIVRARGSSLDTCALALHLIRVMRRTGEAELSWLPVADPATALEVVRVEVGTTWPSFDRTGIDWAELTERRAPDAHDPEFVAGLQRWVAHLGDGHTNVHERGGVAALPYAARAVGDRVVFADVPEGTAAWQAGIRPGHTLLGVDVATIRPVAGAPEHLRPWLVGRRALAGPVGSEATFEVADGSGRTRTFQDTFGEATWPQPIECSRVSPRTVCLRIRRWTPDDEEDIDRALDGLNPDDRLLVDLRGNAGGSLVSAVAFRRRFVDEPTRVGSVQFSIGDGGLSEAADYIDTPSPSTRWLGRTRFLTDGLTYSASEDAVLGLSQFDRIDVVGEPSGGGSGRARMIPLHGDALLTVSTALTFDHLDRGVEGNGIAVDRLLEPDEMSPAGADRDW